MIITFEMKKGHLYRQPLEQKVWILRFHAFCFLCHHYFIHSFRISNCVIWAILVMCLLLSAPEYVQMQLYRQPPEQKVWISTFLLICEYFHIHLHGNFIHFFHYGFKIFMFIISPILRFFCNRDYSTHTHIYIYISCILVV